MSIHEIKKHILETIAPYKDSGKLSILCDGELLGFWIKEFGCTEDEMQEVVEELVTEIVARNLTKKKGTR